MSRRWHDYKKKVAIVGGTHGNESNGVQLINCLREDNIVDKYNFQLLLMHANTRAIELNRRYFEIDLNRCFEERVLNRTSTEELDLYEHELARNINARLGPIGSDCDSRTDFVIDLHNTTAHTGIAFIIVERDQFSIQLYSFIKQLFPEIRLVEWTGVPVLASTGRHSISLEVGAVPQGCLRATLFLRTKEIVLKILDYIHAFNTFAKENETYDYDTAPKVSVELFSRKGDYPFPKDANGEPIACLIHPEVDGHDFEELHQGKDVLLFFNGTTAKWDKPETVYPFLINEAAYYEKDVIFHYAEKLTLTVPQSAVSL